MACPNYNINPNYTPGSNYPQYDYTDIASTAQFDPYAAPRQPQPTAPPVTPYDHYTNQGTGPPAYAPTYDPTYQSTPPPPQQQESQEHFIFDLPPELKSSESSTSSPTSHQQHQPQPHVTPPAFSLDQNKPKLHDPIVASQERAIREIQRQSSSRRSVEYTNNHQWSFCLTPMRNATNDYHSS
jgi:hypothetical protein